MVFLWFSHGYYLEVWGSRSGFGPCAAAGDQLLGAAGGGPAQGNCLGEVGGPSDADFFCQTAIVNSQ